MNAKWTAIAVLACLPGCSGMTEVFQINPTATAVLAPTKGHQARGTVHFTQRSGVVRVEGTLSGLTPLGRHAIHIHERGDCSAPDASSAGHHFEPPAARRAGDLGVLRADSGGQARFTTEIAGISLGADASSIIGRSIVVHADSSGEPMGGEGMRIACGLISKNPDKFF